MAENMNKKLLDICNKGCIAYALCLSKDTGILSTLKNSAKPLTSVDIARENKLKERYVREILGCLVSAQLVHLETNKSTDHLKTESPVDDPRHSDHHTTAAAGDGLPQNDQHDPGAESGRLMRYYLTQDERCSLASGAMWPYLSMPDAMKCAYDDVKACFRVNGPRGQHYNETALRMKQEDHELHTESRIHSLLCNIPGLRDGLNDGIDVIEFGSGAGYFISSLASKFPKSRFTASEVTPELVDILKSKCQPKLPNIQFERHNLCYLEDTVVDNKYDWAFVLDVIHDLPKPGKAFHGVRAILREPGGIFSYAEPAGTRTGDLTEGIGDLTLAAYYARSTFFCIPESFQEEKSAALGRCVGRDTLVKLAQDAGFEVSDFDFAGPVRLFVAKIV